MRQRSRPFSGDLPNLSADKRFGRYKEEPENSAREREASDPALSQLISAWRAFSSSLEEYWEEQFSIAEKLVKPISASSREIEKFIVALAGFQEEPSFSEKAGIFLSALINTSPGTDFVVQTSHLDEALSFLGMKNRKNITILGDVGDHAGYEMENGSLQIKGNCEDGLGALMRGGLIALEGNADDTVGQRMEGGRVIIAESAGNGLGAEMEGGEIIIRGNVYGGVGVAMSGGVINVEGDVISIQEDKGKSKGFFRHTNMSEEVIIIGCRMSGGTIHLNGRYFHMAASIEGGEIYHKGKLIRSKVVE